jgi:hypothetical protein
MKRKTFIVGCLAFIILGTAVWLFTSSSSSRPGLRIPLTLLYYTNDVTGIPTGSYATSNVAHSGFAVFRAHNPTRRDFFCYIGPVFFGDGQIDLRRSQSGDFDLPPGATVTFAVPAPDIPKAWRCGVVLCHKRTYSRLQFAVVRLAERCGLDRSENPWFAVSPEIVK